VLVRHLRKLRDVIFDLVSEWWNLFYCLFLYSENRQTWGGLELDPEEVSVLIVETSDKSLVLSFS